MDVPPAPPPTPEQHFEQRLVACGLDRSGISVSYEEELQSFEIVIGSTAGATEAHFACINEAVGYETVFFEDGALYAAYLKFTSDLRRPQMLADATADLEQRGLLDDFPTRESFDDLQRYVEALEVHSGLSPNSALKVRGDSIYFEPPMDNGGFQDFSNKYSNLLASIRFAAVRGDFENFGFIGNEEVRGSEGE